jgi:hypothetical protein
MFDFLTRRRLIFCLTAILFVTISVLFIAHLHSKVITSYGQSSSLNISKEISTCYLTEPVDIITLCEKCTAYERRSKAAGCLPTGYREYILCSKSNIKTSRSCPVPMQIQKQHFWLFECFIFFLGLAAMANVYLRQKALDKQMVDKIKRQIEESEE